jgi:NADH dehydrogenase
MKIAITGGTGFIGGHLARDLVARGHEVVLIARGIEVPDALLASLDHSSLVRASVTEADRLADAFAGCDAVVDCAGGSREDAHQSYRQVHVDGARSVVAAARKAGISRLVLLSFLRTRPDIASAYHTTKWEGEEIVRASGLDYTVIKAGLVYGRGDHLLDRLGQLLQRMPVVATVGLREKRVRLIAVEDLVGVLRSAVLDHRLSGETVAVVGPEELPFSTIARRIAAAMGKHIFIIPFPVAAQRLLAWFSERFMPEPLVSRSQVDMLADGISEPLPDSKPLPDDLAPRTMFTEDQIRRGLPD